jgi:hypothetical protein
MTRVLRPWQIGAGVAAVGIVVLIGQLTRNHLGAHNRQSPAGIWRSTTADSVEVLLAIRGGPREGTYFQLTRSGDKPLRELGHWAAQGNQLSLIIMATDIPNHPRFGLATPYDLFYLDDTRIRINGADRPEMTYDRVEATPELERELSVSEQE